VGVANADHGLKYIIPGLLPPHHAVREHATVPADVAHGVRGPTSSVAQPIAGDMHNIEFAIGIINETVPPGLVMGAHAFHRRIILSDVEIVSSGP
jgi:hypothetical protein